MIAVTTVTATMAAMEAGSVMARQSLLLEQLDEALLEALGPADVPEAEQDKGRVDPAAQNHQGQGQADQLGRGQPGEERRRGGGRGRAGPGQAAAR